MGNVWLPSSSLLGVCFSVSVGLGREDDGTVMGAIVSAHSSLVSPPPLVCPIEIELTLHESSRSVEELVLRQLRADNRSHHVGEYRDVVPTLSSRKRNDVTSGRCSSSVSLRWD